MFPFSVSHRQTFKLKNKQEFLSFDEVADGQFYIFIITLSSQIKRVFSIKVFSQPLFVLTAFFNPIFHYLLLTDILASDDNITDKSSCPFYKASSFCHYPIGKSSRSCQSYSSLGYIIKMIYLWHLIHNQTAKRSADREIDWSAPGCAGNHSTHTWIWNLI